MPVNLPPGVYVTATTTVASRSAPTDTGTAMVAMLSDRAPATPRLIRSLADFPGTRQSWSVGYDWADTYFHEGGTRAYISVARGPAAAKATLNLAGTGTTLIVNAKDYGEYANGANATGYKIAVINGPVGGSGTRVIQVLANDGTTVLEQTSEFTDQAGGVTAGIALTRVDIVAGGGSGLPTVAAAANLTGGTTDHAGVLDAHHQTAVDAFSTDLGPGNIAAPDWATDAGRTYIKNSAAGRNRFAVADPPDTTSKATLTTAAGVLQGTANSSYVAMYAPWLTIPGTAAGSIGRSVPPSALVLAKIAQNDATISANQSPAGDFGAADYVTGVKATFNRDTISGVNDAGDLNAAGVNLVISQVTGQGGVQIKVYGIRTMVSPTGVDQNLLQVGTCRYRMSAVARARVIGEQHVFDRISLTTIEAWNTALTGMLLADYVNGDLFGDLDDDRPETAFSVDTITVNRPDTIQAGQLNAALAVRPTKGAEMINISITLVATNQPVV